MSERDFQSQVVTLARALGWHVAHTFDSRRSQAGFPDLCLLHLESGRLMFRELKRQDGRLRPEQSEWLASALRGGHDVAVWRPSDLVSRRIERELRVRV
ncbi:VRR-NUC domain-containing protein [Brevibacterium sp. 91QC2O2]|nr:VRR-NUC domain-containing protein [Brevibacterium sp. 91QC2O2]